MFWAFYIVRLLYEPIRLRGLTRRDYLRVQNSCEIKFKALQVRSVDIDCILKIVLMQRFLASVDCKTVRSNTIILDCL